MDEEEDESGLGATRYPCMPSLVSLQYMRNRLHLGHLGQKLMRWTAMATGKELRRIAMRLQQLYRKFCEQMCNAYIVLARARYFCPRVNRMVIENKSKCASVTVAKTTKLLASVKVPHYEVIESGQEPYEHLGIEKGGQQVHVAKIVWLKLLKKMIMIQDLRLSFLAVHEAYSNATKEYDLLETIQISRDIQMLDFNTNLQEMEKRERVPLNLRAEKQIVKSSTVNKSTQVIDVTCSLKSNAPINKNYSNIDNMIDDPKRNSYKRDTNFKFNRTYTVFPVLKCNRNLVVQNMLITAPRSKTESDSEDECDFCKKPISKENKKRSLHSDSKRYELPLDILEDALCDHCLDSVINEDAKSFNKTHSSKINNSNHKSLDVVPQELCDKCIKRIKLEKYEPKHEENTANILLKDLCESCKEQSIREQQIDKEKTVENSFDQRNLSRNRVYSVNDKHNNGSTKMPTDICKFCSKSCKSQVEEHDNRFESRNFCSDKAKIVDLLIKLIRADVCKKCCNTLTEQKQTLANALKNERINPTKPRQSDDNGSPEFVCDICLKSLIEHKTKETIFQNSESFSVSDSDETTSPFDFLKGELCDVCFKTLTETKIDENPKKHTCGKANDELSPCHIEQSLCRHCLKILVKNNTKIKSKLKEIKDDLDNKLRSIENIKMSLDMLQKHSSDTRDKKNCKTLSEMGEQTHRPLDDFLENICDHCLKSLTEQKDKTESKSQGNIRIKRDEPSKITQKSLCDFCLNSLNEQKTRKAQRVKRHFDHNLSCAKGSEINRSQNCESKCGRIKRVKDNLNNVSSINKTNEIDDKIKHLSHMKMEPENHKRNSNSQRSSLNNDTSRRLSDDSQVVALNFKCSCSKSRQNINRKASTANDFDVVYEQITKIIRTEQNDGTVNETVEVTKHEIERNDIEPYESGDKCEHISNCKFDVCSCSSNVVGYAVSNMPAFSGIKQSKSEKITDATLFHPVARYCISSASLESEYSCVDSEWITFHKNKSDLMKLVN